MMMMMMMMGTVFQHGVAAVAVPHVCTVKLKSVVRSEGRQREVGRTRSTGLYLKPWYSPTGTYLQIQSPEGAVACRSVLALSVNYTSRTALPPANQFRYSYQVMLIAVIAVVREGGGSGGGGSAPCSHLSPSATV